MRHRGAATEIEEIHQYIYAGGKLLREAISDGTITKTLDFTYDNVGMPYSLIYNDGTTTTTYYYISNLQGDVMYLVDANGVQVAAYDYDPYGKVITSTGDLAEINPLKYRGYYYDSETGFYYVSCRYYDSTIGRWISPEPNIYIGAIETNAGFIGYNVYAYCANNPINYIDITGEYIISTLLICVIAGAIIGGVAGGLVGNAYAEKKEYTGKDKTKCILTGIGIGGLIGGVAGYYAAPAVVSATGVAGVSISSAGVSTIAAIGTSFGKLGTLIANNGNQIIDWGNITQHGLRRMAERGVKPSMVELWVRTGKALQQAGDKILYITKQGNVVVNKAGQIIAAYSSEYFDAAMQEVVRKLFGK